VRTILTEASELAHDHLDSLIFMKANGKSASRLNEIPRIYEQCSGQCVNWKKISIYFSSNTTIHCRQQLKEIMGITVEAFSEHYLGFPTAVGQLPVAHLVT
jgi:hypothetical protein